MSPLVFYQQQADQQKAAANASPLQNVKERCQRASDAWAALADRTERSENSRRETASTKLLSGLNENPDRGFAEV